MPANKRFYDQVHFALARYNTQCSECPIKIEIDEPVVFLSGERLTMHAECFRNGPMLPRGDLSKEIKRERTYKNSIQFINLLSSIKGGKSNVVTKCVH